MSTSSFDELLDRSNLTGRQFLIYAGQRLHPGVPLYNSVYAIGWPDLDPERFNRAWQRVVDTCDALRTVVEEIDGVPQQHVLSSFEAPIERVDLGEHEERSAAVKAWIDQRLRRPLILAERIYDTALLRTSRTDYAWFLHIHHIVVDGAAVQILIRRTTELYTSDEPVGSEPPQFAERAASMCGARRSVQYQTAKVYWQELLRVVPATPRFYGVEASASTAQERVVLRLDSATSAAITALAHSLATEAMSEHAVAANLFNALFAAYLSRVGATEQISIGVTFHNRSTKSDRLTIGLFMEVFPICVRIRPEDTLRSTVQQVASQVTKALKYREYSVGHSARNPSFSGLFNYMRALAKPLVPLHIRRIHAAHGSNSLSLSVEPHDDMYDLWFDVNSEVAATSSAQRLAEHLRTLIAAAARAPDKPLRQLAVLPERETTAILAACRGPRLETTSEYGPAVHSRFEREAANAPDARAIVFGDLQLTYRQLNEAANTLARRLRALGASRGKRVGICLERSPEMVIAVIAALKTGAAYVPLEPSYPASRLETMLIDANPSVVFTTRDILRTLPAHAARVLCVEDVGALPGESDGDLDLSIGPQDTAYIMYTSGSTGAPKGVLVTHGNVVNHLAWRDSFFPVGPQDRCLQTASLGFDDSVWEIFEPLSSGGSLILTRPRYEYDSRYLVKLMIEQQVTVACFVPSLLQAVIEEAAIVECKSIRRLTTGGERLSVALQRRVAARLPEAALYNGYGTTESTIASLYWRCRSIPGQESVPIGQPIANTEVYILDADRQLVPPGVTGEIYIGGAGVAHGYLNRPDLSSVRFVTNPFSIVPAARLYRTGDLGCLRADGIFEFGGRSDDQVKVRGVRVELGDIEAALLDHPGVRGAAVVCDQTPSGAQLTAFYIARSDTLLSSTELRTFVRDRIPAALVPNRFELVAALPVTASGKIDKNALPKFTVVDDRNNYVPPRTESEIGLVKLWEDVIQTRPIGIRDDFFTLGGHSLLAVQIAAAISETVGRPLSPGLLFEAPTIEMLSSRLSTPQHATGCLVRLADGGTKPALFLVHHVSGDVTAYRDLARYLGTERVVYGIRAPELENNETPLDRIELMATRYVREILGVQPRGPYLIGGHSAGAHIAFEIAQQLHAASQEVSLLAILEADAQTWNGRRRSPLDPIRHEFDKMTSLPLRQRVLYLWRRLSILTKNPRQRRLQTWQNQQLLEPRRSAVWAAIERAVYQYRPRPYPGAITVFRATDRRVTGTYSRTLGWGRLARAGVRVIDVPGSHSTVLRPGSEPPMASKLRVCLELLAPAPEPRTAVELAHRPP